VRVLLSSLCLCLTLATAAAAQQTPVRLTQLHDALHLDGQQEEAWRSYTAAIAPSDQAQARRHATEQMLPKLTTPRRIALLDATMEQDLTDRRRQGDAVIAFYGRLTPAQQAVFDRQTLQSPTGASGN
jgi:protein CpxP